MRPVRVIFSSMTNPPPSFGGTTRHPTLSEPSLHLLSLAFSLSAGTSQCHAGCAARCGARSNFLPPVLSEGFLNQFLKLFGRVALTAKTSFLHLRLNHPFRCIRVSAI